MSREKKEINNRSIDRREGKWLYQCEECYKFFLLFEKINKDKWPSCPYCQSIATRLMIGRRKDDNNYNEN